LLAGVQTHAGRADGVLESTLAKHHESAVESRTRGGGQRRGGVARRSVSIEGIAAGLLVGGEVGSVTSIALKVGRGIAVSQIPIVALVRLSPHAALEAPEKQPSTDRRGAP